MILIYNADIHTMHPAQPRAQALVMEGERVAYAGTLPGARLYLGGRPHDAIDAQGATVLPGFNDSHMHLLHTALRGARVLLPGARDIAAAQALLREGLARPMQGWVIGEGYHQERLAEGRLLTRQDLDAVSAETPVIAVRACGHLLTANSAALALAGLDIPDGILREDEQSAIWRCVPDMDMDARLASLEAAQHGLHRQGITSVQSDDIGGMSVDGQAAFLTGVRDRCADGRLRLRYASQANLPTRDEMEAFLAAGLHTLRGPGFRVSHAKLLTDGSLGARTAWLSREYTDAPGVRGIAMYEDGALAAQVALAAAHGLPSAIHAIGDEALRQTLDALAAAPCPRHAVVHAQMMSAQQAIRCGQMGLMILAQPIFLDADAPIVRARTGSLADTSYRWRTMGGAGAHIAFGTDCPVEPYDPLPGLYCAVARRTLRGGEPYLPEEGFALAEALYAYTAAGAAASGEAGEKGQLVPGQLADVIILSGAMRAEAPESWRQLAVRTTFVGGVPVYGA